MHVFDSETLIDLEIQTLSDTMSRNNFDNSVSVGMLRAADPAFNPVSVKTPWLRHNTTNFSCFPRLCQPGVVAKVRNVMATMGSAAGSEGHPAVMGRVTWYSTLRHHDNLATMLLIQQPNYKVNEELGRAEAAQWGVSIKGLLYFDTWIILIPAEY